MKLLVAFSLLLLMATVTAFAQPVLKKGYVIMKSSNDTVYGLIESKGNKTNTQVCIFRKYTKSEPQSFTPNDIAGYRLESNKYYVAKTVIVNDKIEMVFLEYLVDGIVDMFYYYDGTSEHFFVDGGDNQLLELKENPVTEYYATYLKRAIPNSKPYIGVLKYIFKDSPKISKRVETIDLSRKSLIDITIAYHKDLHADEAIIYAKRIKNSKYIPVGIIAGVGCVAFTYFILPRILF